MRVLVIATPSTTHFASMVPLAWALRAAGHDVLVLGQPDITPAARAAGLATVEVGEVFDTVELAGWSLPPDVRPIEAGLHKIMAGNWAAATSTWSIHAMYQADAHLAVARAWRPDLVVADPLEYTSLLIGGLLDVPVVHHRWGVDPLGPPGLDLARTALRPLCHRLGLAGGLPEPALVLDPCPPTLQLDTVPPGQPIRGLPYNGGGTVPSWALAPGAVRRICVCFGRVTAALNGVPLHRHVVAALGGLEDVETVVAVDAAFHAGIGPLPPNVRLVADVPISAYVPDCRLVVHHGGAATALTATAYGLPQLVLPGMMDGFPYADRIVAAGAGLALTEADEQNDPAAIRAAARQLLDEPAHGRRAAALRDEMAAMPAPAAVVPVLERLAARRVRPAAAVR